MDPRHDSLPDPLGRPLKHLILKHARRSAAFGSGSGRVSRDRLEGVLDVISKVFGGSIEGVEEGCYRCWCYGRT